MKLEEKMSYKSLLLLYCQKRKMRIPVYQVRREGPDHVPRFTATVRVTGDVETEYTGRTSSTTKKDEHEAAMVALESLNAPAAGLDGVAAVVGAAAVVVAAAITPTLSHKCMLQELCQRFKLRMPRYDWLQSGPDHDPFFWGSVFVDGKIFLGGNWGTSIKIAEDGAAEHALHHFRNHPVGGATV